MTTSALLQHGPEYAAELLEGLSSWMKRKEFGAVEQMRGLLSAPGVADQAEYQRSGYVAAMRAANAGAYAPWHAEA
jgi:dihydroorotate dehydrogenase (fumarate)